MQQIADWLQKLGLGQYAQCFAENEIDVSVLRHLTDQDLKDVGVPLGHRRKILAAIAELGSTPAVAPAAAARYAGADFCRCCAATDLRSGRSHRRAPLSHGDVLRSGGFDRHFREA